MRKLWAVICVLNLFIVCSLQAEKCKQCEKDCTTTTCYVDLLQSPQILGDASVKKITIPCETDFPQEGSNVLDVSAKGGNNSCKEKFSKIGGIFNKVTVVPGESYCITAIGKVIDTNSAVKIYLQQNESQIQSSTDSLTNNFRIVTLNFVANDSSVNIALGVNEGIANFEVQKFTLAASEPCTFTPLNILLTNDDGYSFVGIQSLKTTFEAAGHNVFLIAPSSEIDGTSSAVNLPTTTPLPQFALVQQVSTNEWKVSIVNSPSATASNEPAFPVTAFAQAPLAFPGINFDLVLVGINAEALNAGPIANISGTVGVARVAVTDVDTQIPPTPAIAVSIDNNLNSTFVNQVADFVLDLVTQLQCSNFAKKTGKLLPPNTALNVNYPNLSPSDIKGVKITRQGIISYGTHGTALAGIPIGAVAVQLVPPPPPVGPTAFVSAIELAPLPHPVIDIPDSDSLAVQQGYISIEPITGDLTAPSCSTKDIIDTMGQLSFPAFGTYLPENAKIRFCPRKE